MTSYLTRTSPLTATSAPACHIKHQPACGAPPALLRAACTRHTTPVQTGIQEGALPGIPTCSKVSGGTPLCHSLSTAHEKYCAPFFDGGACVGLHHGHDSQGISTPRALQPLFLYFNHHFSSVRRERRGERNVNMGAKKNTK